MIFFHISRGMVSITFFSSRDKVIWATSRHGTRGISMAQANGILDRSVHDGKFTLSKNSSRGAIAGEEPVNYEAGYLGAAKRRCYGYPGCR